MPATGDVAIYWDTSAVIATLFEEPSSARARSTLARYDPHFMSSLGWAEVLSVIERVSRASPHADVDRARAAVGQGPWLRVSLSPDWEVAQGLSRKWALRGADLWHLACVLTLRRSLPVLLFAFDEALREAAAGEGILLPD